MQNANPMQCYFTIYLTFTDINIINILIQVLFIYSLSDTKWDLITLKCLMFIVTINFLIEIKRKLAVQQFTENITSANWYGNLLFSFE